VRRQSAVFVSVAADDLVGEFRARHQPRAVARRLPPHITVVPPFWREVDSDQQLDEAFEQHFATLEPFAAELVRVDRFPRHVWLAPEPRERFVELITATRARFRELARAGELEPVPHLTIAETGKGESTRAIADRAEQELGRLLPLAFSVSDVGLFEVRPEGWHELRRFRLG
jgi:2'-5' RNA ligase